MPVRPLHSRVTAKNSFTGDAMQDLTPSVSTCDMSAEIKMIKALLGSTALTVRLIGLVPGLVISCEVGLGLIRQGQGGGGVAAWAAFWLAR